MDLLNSTREINVLHLAVGELVVAGKELGRAGLRAAASESGGVPHKELLEIAYRFQAIAKALNEYKRDISADIVEQIKEANADQDELRIQAEQDPKVIKFFEALGYGVGDKSND